MIDDDTCAARSLAAYIRLGRRRSVISPLVVEAVAHRWRGPPRMPPMLSNHRLSPPSSAMMPGKRAHPAQALRLERLAAPQRMRFGPGERADDGRNGFGQHIAQRRGRAFRPSANHTPSRSVELLFAQGRSCAGSLRAPVRAAGWCAGLGILLAVQPSVASGRPMRDQRQAAGGGRRLVISRHSLRPAACISASR